MCTAPTRPGSGPQEWWTHLALHQEGHSVAQEAAHSACELVDHCAVSERERELIKHARVGRAAKQRAAGRGCEMAEHLEGRETNPRDTKVPF